jgi:hypothetical protein
MSKELIAKPGNAENRGNGRRTLWLIFAVCVIPFFGAFLIYRFAPPDEHMNYGELVTRPLPDTAFRNLEGGSVRLSEFRGKWLLVHVDDARCDARCVDKMYKLRQIRLAQGKNMERVLRVWVISDEAPVDAKISAEYAGTTMLRGRVADLLPQLPVQSDIRDHVWVIDPLGNLVLKYPPKADASGIRKDLQRLLKVSRIG